MKNLFRKSSDNKNKSSKSQKLKTMVISLLSAIAVWLVVVYINDPSITITMTDLNVRFAGEMALKESGYVITGKNDIPVFSATVKGKRSDLMSYMNDIYVTIDISDVTESGEHEFDANVEMPNSRLTLEKTNISTVTLNVENMERKEIQVMVKQTGTNKNYLIESQIEDAYVEITGAKSDIDKVSYGIASVDISGIEQADSAEYGFVMYDKNNSIIEKNETLEAQKATVRVNNIPYKKVTLTVIPQLSDELQKNYMIDMQKTVITPVTIEVGVLDNFTDDAVYVNVDKNTDKETEFYIKQKDGLYTPKNSVKIKPVIIKKSTKIMSFKVNAVNIPEGMTADFAQEITIALECAESLTADNVRVEIDLNNMTAGSYKVPIKVEGENILSYSPSEIDVTLK